jgi:PAS domain S-box-containing protein
MIAPRTILVVDENVAELSATVRILEKAGYDVRSAGDGATALAQARESQPDLILLDLALPDTPGSEVLRQIKTDPKLNGITVVLFAATQSSPQQQAGGLDAGADDYITRPIANEELLARVRSYLRHRELTDRLRASEREQRDLAEKLADERKKLIAAQAVAKVGSWETDLVSMTVSWSLETHRIFETHPDDFQPTHQTFLERVHPDDRPAVDRAFLDSVNEERSCSIEHRAVMPDGSIKFLQERWVVVYEGHRPVRAVGTCQDISDRKEIEEESRLLAERLKTTLESITDAFFTVNQEWRFTFVNREAERLLGRTRADLIGRDLWSEFPAAGASTFEHECRRAMERGESVALEEFFRPLNIWISARAYPSPQGLVVYFSDISARRHAEQALRTSEAEFRTLAEAMPQIVWATRADGGNIYFNQRWTEYTGLTLEESLGDGWIQPFHPAHRQRAQEAWQQATATGGVYSLECPLRRADGTYHWWLVRGAALRDAEGKILKWFGTCTDIDELKRAQERIAEQAALIDEARDAIIVRDLDHRILFWSKGAERIYGWRAEEVRGRHMQELLQAEKAKYAEASAAVIDAGVWNGEIRKIGKNGAEHILDCCWTLLKNEHGLPKSILSLDTDVTAQKKIEQQFLRAQRMESIGTLAGGIAHDLNNLLAPILLGVGLLKQGEAAPDRIKLMDTIERSAQRGAGLVKQVLSFARGVESSRIGLQVRHLIRDLESILENTFPKNIRFETEYGADLAMVMADPTQLNQVLLNLCVNARDAMPDGGRLTVSARTIDIDPQYAVMDRMVPPGKYVVIEVSDTGCGMPQEIIDRIFEPFFTTKDFGKGTGLGLSTVQGIMRSHGGFVHAYSEVGKGSVFKVYLVAIADGTDGTVQLPATERMPRGNGETILVVDDEVSILDITRQTLQSFGYKVLTAEDGAHAIGLYALHRQEISAVLTDMMMPVMDGQTLIFALRRINPSVRVIAASGLMAHDNLTRTANTGVKHFLPKPYPAAAMLTLLRKVLSEG